MTTLLEKMADAMWAHIDEADRDDCILGLKAALKVALTPTHAMVNRGGVKAFSGPQPEGGPPMIYPALIWREMLSFVIEEADRERNDEESPEGEGEGGREPGVLPEDPVDRGSEPGAEPEAGDRAL